MYIQSRHASIQFKPVFQTEEESGNNSNSKHSKMSNNVKVKLENDESRSFIQKPWLDYLKEVLPGKYTGT